MKDFRQPQARHQKKRFCVSILSVQPRKHQSKSINRPPQASHNEGKIAKEESAMSVLTSRMSILNSLQTRRSRSSAAAIGHEYVLNGSPAPVQIRGIDALVRMPCDWTVAILKELIEDPLRNCLVRQYAIRRLAGLLLEAVESGYWGISRPGVNKLVSRAIATMFRSGPCNENGAAQEICSHLSEAVEGGCFDPLPDF